MGHRPRWLVGNVIQRSEGNRTRKFWYLVTKAGRRDLKARRLWREGGLLMSRPAGKRGFQELQVVGQVLQNGSQLGISAGALNGPPARDPKLPGS